MKLSKDQVKKVAKLANLPISEQEEEKYGEQLSKVLGYIDQLNKVDVSGILPTYNVTGLDNILQVDIVKPSLTQKESLQNTDTVKDGYFLTKGVFENE